MDQETYEQNQWCEKSKNQINKQINKQTKSLEKNRYQSKKRGEFKKVAGHEPLINVLRDILKYVASI